MAGEWIKFESNLPEKPETLAITAAMGWDDPDLTVGKLMRLFRWFDQQTTDGNARGVTALLLDRIIGVSGFAKAVESAGWIEFTEAGVSLGKFDRHNGASAKARAQTAKRVANHRGNARASAVSPTSDESGNAVAVTSALAREEKRRDIGTPRKARRSSVPDDFKPNEAGLKAANEAGINVERELTQFRNHHEAKGTAMANWQAAWRTWVGMAVQFGRGGKPANDDPYGLRNAL